MVKVSTPMSTKDAEERAQAFKLRAKKLRREAYVAAKKRCANDPKVIAMKEAMKKKRHQAYQQAKEKMKAERAVATAVKEADREGQRTKRRATADDALKKSVTRGGSAPFAPEPRKARSSDVPPEVRVTVIARPDGDPYGPN
jgi:hypothetical protein